MQSTQQFIILYLYRYLFVISVVAASFLGLTLSYLFAVKIAWYTNSKSHNLPDKVLYNPAANNITQIALYNINRSSIEDLVVGKLIQGTIDRTGVQGSEASLNVVLEKLKLLGTISGNRNVARALIRREDKSINSYKVGDDFTGMKLVSILLEHIILKTVDNQEIIIKVGEENKTTGASKKKELGKSIKGDQILLKRSHLNRMLQDQTEFFKIKSAPDIKNGDIVGWRLIYVPKNHFLHEMGARSGDIIRSFNGLPLKNQQRMFEIYQSLSTLDSATISIERRGQLIDMEVVVQ